MNTRIIKVISSFLTASVFLSFCGCSLLKRDMKDASSLDRDYDNSDSLGGDSAYKVNGEIKIKPFTREAFERALEQVYGKKYEDDLIVYDSAEDNDQIAGTGVEGKMLISYSDPNDVHADVCFTKYDDPERAADLFYSFYYERFVENLTTPDENYKGTGIYGYNGNEGYIVFDAEWYDQVMYGAIFLKDNVVITCFTENNRRSRKDKIDEMLRAMQLPCPADEL